MNREFVASYLEDAVYLADSMEANENTVVALHNVLKQLETAIQTLNDQNIRHGHLNAKGNILVHADRVIIIDFDRAEIVQPVNRVFGYPAFLSDELRDEFGHIFVPKNRHTQGTATASKRESCSSAKNRFRIETEF